MIPSCCSRIVVLYCFRVVYTSSFVLKIVYSQRDRTNLVISSYKKASLEKYLIGEFSPDHYPNFSLNIFASQASYKGGWL